MAAAAGLASGGPALVSAPGARSLSALTFLYCNRVRFCLRASPFEKPKETYSFVVAPISRHMQFVGLLSESPKAKTLSSQENLVCNYLAPITDGP